MSLSNLLADPTARRVVANRGEAGVNRTCRIADANGDGKSSAEVFIYGFIDPFPWEEFGDVSANNFVGQLAALDVDEISVRINSPGGDVFDALAITNALRSHPAKVTTIVEGLAASAASFIAQAGDTVIIRPNAEIMIHDPSGIAIGNPTEIGEFAAWLDRAGNNIAAIYAERAGGSVADWREAMKAETWYSAEEAVEAGLADVSHADPIGSTPITEDNRTESAAAFADIRRAFAHSCRAEAPAPIMPVISAGRQDGIDMPLREDILKRLGLAETASDTAMLEALDSVTELATRPDAQVSDVAQVTAFAEANGLRVVDGEKFGAMEAELTEHRAAVAERDAADRAAVIDAALTAGKITPGRRDHFVALMDADPVGTAALLDGLPAELAVPIVEAGTAQGADDDVDAEYHSFLNQINPSAVGAENQEN